jgi:hypothetical protein
LAGDRLDGSEQASIIRIKQLDQRSPIAGWVGARQLRHGDDTIHRQANNQPGWRKITSTHMPPI